METKNIAVEDQVDALAGAMMVMYAALLEITNMETVVYGGLPMKEIAADAIMTVDLIASTPLMPPVNYLKGVHHGTAL